MVKSAQIDILYVTSIIDVSCNRISVPMWALMLLTIDDVNFLFCWSGILTLDVTNVCRITPSGFWAILAKMMLFLKLLVTRISYPEVFRDSWILRRRYWLRVSIRFCLAGNKFWTGRLPGFSSGSLTGSWTGFWTGSLSFFLESDSHDVLKINEFLKIEHMYKL